MLVDATYKTNKYQIPLVVSTGISNEGKNVLFGLCLMNDETYESYRWALKKFFQHNKSIPELILTDQDPAIIKAVEQENSVHLLCQWHISRNLRRKFSFSKSENEDLYKKILDWPYLNLREVFEEHHKELEAYFTLKPTYEKSLNQLKS